MAKLLVEPLIGRHLPAQRGVRPYGVLNQINVMWLLIIVTTIRPLIDLSGDANKGLNAGGLLAMLFCPTYLVLYTISDRMRYRTGHILTFAFAALAILAAFVDHFSPNLVQDTGSAPFQQAIREFCGMTLIGLPFAYFGNSAQKNLRMFEIFFIVLLLACIVPVVIAYLQFLGRFPFTYFDVLDGQYVGRPSGGYTQPNSLARLLVFLTFCAYFRVLFITGKRDLKLYSLVGFLMITLFITTHRISLLCGIIVCTGMEFLIGFSALELIVVLFVAFPALCVSLLFSIDAIAQSSMVRSLFAFASDGQISTRGRATMWAGADQFFDSLPGANRILGIGREPFTLDSDFWRILFVHGALGTFLFLAGLLVSFASLIRITRGKKRGAICILYLYLLIYMVTLEPTSYTLFMWILFSLLYFVRSAPESAAGAVLWNRVPSSGAADRSYDNRRHGPGLRLS